MITNINKGITIAKNYKLCCSVLSQLRGLMFSPKKTLVFFFKKPKQVSLHMFFVFFPIDVAYLNKNMEVVELKRNLKPFQIYAPKNKAQYIIETPVGNLKSTEIGDKIKITFKNKPQF